VIKKIRRYILPVLVCFMAFSCSKTEPQVEVISIEELLGEKDSAQEAQEDEISLPELDGSFVSEINQKLYTKYNLGTNTKRTLIDRFSIKETEKTHLISKTDSSAITEFYLYTFPDSTLTMNAFNNLLACFGASCAEVTLQENRARVDEQPLWCGVFETSIVILKFSASAIGLKDELKQTVFQTKSEALKYTLNVNERSELKWD